MRVEKLMLKRKGQERWGRKGYRTGASECVGSPSKALCFICSCLIYPCSNKWNEAGRRE